MLKPCRWMTVAMVSVFLGATVAAQSASAPLLVVVNVIPRDDVRGLCALELANVHTRDATAWVLMRNFPGGYALNKTDVVLAPGLELTPGETTVCSFSCEPDEPYLNVAAVLYDDGTAGGDAKVLELAVLKPRRERVEGLRELAGLLASASLPPGDPRDGLREFIRLSVGPRIDRMVRSTAVQALERARTQAEQASHALEANELRDRLLAEIELDIRRLEGERIALQEVRR